jgi:hypothetical protein
MTQRRDLGSNAIETGLRELQEGRAARQEDPGYNATVRDFLNSKTFKRKFLRLSHDRTTGGTIALYQAAYLCALAWHAGRESASPTTEPTEPQPMREPEHSAFMSRVEEITKGLNADVQSAWMN